MTNIQIGTILIAKEDIKMKDGSGVAIIKGNEYKIKDLILDVFIVKSELFDNHEFDIEDLDKYFTIKRYTLTDLNEKKIAVKLKSEEEFKRISPNDDYIWFFDNSYFGYENGQFTFIDNKSLTKQGYILIPSIDLIDLEEKEESKVVESHHVKQLESIDEIDLGDEGKEVVVNDCETDAIYIAKLETEISRLDEQIARLKGELDKWKDEAALWNTRYHHVLSNLTDKTNELNKLRESPQISQDLEKRERMAWELFMKYEHLEIDRAFELTDTFLAKSKEVGNGK